MISLRCSKVRITILVRFIAREWWRSIMTGISSWPIPTRTIIFICIVLFLDVLFFLSIESVFFANFWQFLDRFGWHRFLSFFHFFGVFLRIWLIVFNYYHTLFHTHIFLLSIKLFEVRWQFFIFDWLLLSLWFFFFWMIITLITNGVCFQSFLVLLFLLFLSVLVTCYEFATKPVEKVIYVEEFGCSLSLLGYISYCVSCIRCLSQINLMPFLKSA